METPKTVADKIFNQHHCSKYRLTCSSQKIDAIALCIAHHRL